MITQIKVGKNYINISVAITNNTGVPIDPTMAEAWFYKVSQVDGSLSLDTNIDTNGKVTLIKQDNQTGFYGVSIPTSTLSEAEYVVLYKITAELSESITVEYLSIDLSKKKIEDNLDTKISEIKSETDKIQVIDSNIDLIKIETNKIKYILGLNQENFRILSPFYDENHNLISAIIKLYPTKNDTDNDINSFAEYIMTSVYNEANEMTSYKMVKN